MIIANSATHTLLAIYHLISNMRLWNNNIVYNKHSGEMLISATALWSQLWDHGQNYRVHAVHVR